MAHLEKYKAHSVGNLCAHYRREPRAMGRANIDPARTHLNYVIGEDWASWKVVSGRRDVVNSVRARKIRKDAVLMLDLVVTLPDNVPTEDARRFFTLCYEWLGGKVGEGNLLGGYVHMDESRPHIHIPFTPIVGTPPNFSAKRLCPRSFYQTMHRELSDYVERGLGYRAHVELSEQERAQRVYVERTADIDRARAALSACTAKERAEQAEAARAAAEAARGRDNASAQLRAVAHELDETRDKLAAAESERKQVRRELADAKGELKATNEIFLPAARSNLEHEWDELAKAKAERQEMAAQLQQAKAEVEALRGENEALKGQVAIGRSERDRLARELDRMGDERRAMANELELLRRRMSMFVAAARAFVGAVRARGLGHALAEALAKSDKNPLVRDMFDRADNNPDADYRLYDDVLEQSGYEVLNEEQADIDDDLGRVARTYGLDDAGGSVGDDDGLR